MRYIVHAKAKDPENDMTIECYDTADMNKYAKACEKQGYEVRTEVQNDN